ncbi:hypothetical protein [Salinicoccus sp. HZC-1]|uniref:hypothetical protein n=1 Tax=Salinicoccus sp. HZC-1 TaxID=3385497 RepID=UPI00398AFC77
MTAASILMRKSFYGKFVWVEDLVTDENVRSEGHVETLLNFVHDWARDHHYELRRHSSNGFLGTLIT